MIRALRRRGTVALGLGLTAVLVAATGCGDDDDAAAGGGEGDQVTLTVNVFGNFGYADLYKEFQASHPNVKIVERGSLGPVLRSSTVWRLRHLATVFGLIPRSRLNVASEACDRCIAAALLHKASDVRGPPFPRRIHPTVSVTGMPSAV